jgi:hypothetical protein
MPTTATDSHQFDPTPELLGDMTRSDLVYVLQSLEFRKKDSSCLVRIDEPARDFLVDRLAPSRSPKPVPDPPAAAPRRISSLNDILPDDGSGARPVREG